MANIVEPIIGASLVLAWCAGAPDLRQRRDLMAFGTGACVLGPAAGGLIGGTTSHLYDQSGWFVDVLHWWAGDALGVLVVGTPILLWTKQSSIVKSRPVETVVVLLLTAVVSAVAFQIAAPPTILILPLLAWAALRLDMLGAALAGGVTAFAATITVSHGGGALMGAELSPDAELVVTQLFVAVVMTVGLMIAQEASARVRAVTERETERRELPKSRRTFEQSQVTKI